jgi:hypothetical protein
MFLQSVVVLVGIAALAFLLWEPRVEGVNANATNFEVYADPFIVFVYAGSVPFFIALYQAFRVLGYAAQGKAFSPEVMSALRTMKRCGAVMVGFVVVGEIFILSSGTDDRPPALFMGMLVTIGSLTIVAMATTLERIAQGVRTK